MGQEGASGDGANAAEAPVPAPRHGASEKLRETAKRAGFDKLNDGTRFQRAIVSHIKKHEAATPSDHWDVVFPSLDREARADRLIRAATRKASVAGVAASVGASAGELVSLVTEGLGAPIGVPAAMVSMATEAAYTARLQMELACDLASLYGAPFDPDDFGEVATLFGMAFEIDIRMSKTDEQRSEEGLTARLMALEDGEFARRIGRKLLEEAVMRNIVPFVGIGISARWNYVATRRFRAHARKYARYRRVLRHACERLHLREAADPALVVEGAWLLATADGDAGHEELLAIGLLLDGAGIELRSCSPRRDQRRRGEVVPERLATTAQDAHGPLLDVLYLVASADRALEAPERRFLRRVGKAIGREIDLDRVAQFVSHLSEGEELPAVASFCTRGDGAR